MPLRQNLGDSQFSVWLEGAGLHGSAAPKLGALALPSESGSLPLRTALLASPWVNREPIRGPRRARASLLSLSYRSSFLAWGQKAPGPCFLHPAVNSRYWGQRPSSSRQARWPALDLGLLATGRPLQPSDRRCLACARGLLDRNFKGGGCFGGEGGGPDVSPVASAAAASRKNRASWLLLAKALILEAECAGPRPQCHVPRRWSTSRAASGPARLVPPLP